jgi:hypothetical protein
MDRQLQRKMTAEFGSKFIPKGVITDLLGQVREGRKEVMLHPESNRKGRLIEIRNSVDMVARHCRIVMHPHQMLRLEREMARINKQMELPGCRYEPNGAESES